MRRFFFVISVALVSLGDCLRGRAMAINATPLTPTETSRGTDNLQPDAAIAFKNAVVKKGSDDRHFAATNGQADIPYGVLLNDEVDSGEVGSPLNKTIAVFGLYPDSIPCVSDGSGAIAANDRIVASVASPGKVKKMPATSGQTYVVIGRARLAVAATDGDPVSLVHSVPREITNP
jgi:hypothetical protein